MAFVLDDILAALKRTGGEAAVPVNRSGTITTGGSAQQLAAANTARKGLGVQNQSSGSLWIYELGTATLAQPSWEIKAGETLVLDNGSASTAAISIIGATTGQAFAAREW